MTGLGLLPDRGSKDLLTIDSFAGVRGWQTAVRIHEVYVYSACHAERTSEFERRKPA